MSFVERLSLFRSVHYRRFHCIIIITVTIYALSIYHVTNFPVFAASMHSRSVLEQVEEV